MKKWATIFVASAMLVTASLPGSAAAANNVKQGEIVSGVSFREAPRATGSFIRYLKTGERVTIMDQPNAYWYKVRSENGDTGYVSTQAKYIKASGSRPADPGPSNTVSAPVNGALPSHRLSA